MKRFILPSIALAFVLGACSTRTQTGRPPGLPPQATGPRVTVWGELPTYDPAGQSFNLTAEKLRAPVVDQTRFVTLDVLVNADGSVRDAVIRASSGNPVLDGIALGAYAGARYSLQLDASQAAPHVVSQAIIFKKEADTRVAARVIDTSLMLNGRPSLPQSTALQNHLANPQAAMGSGSSSNWSSFSKN